MSFKLTFVLLMITLVQYGECAPASSPSYGSDSVTCPVSYNKKCYKMFDAPPGSAFTRWTGEKLCETLDFGSDGHLADCNSKELFYLLINYMRKQAPNRDPNVLLGMTYAIRSKTIYTFNGDILEKPYWGPRSRPLSYGTNMVIRASDIDTSNKLQNFGDESNRYRRVMCEYVTK